MKDNMYIGINDINNVPIRIGTKVRFIPDRSDKGFMNSNFGQWCDKYDLGEVYFEFIENVYELYGFSYRITAVKQNGEPFVDGDKFPELLEFNEDDTEEYIEENKRLASKIVKETLTDYEFINYVSKKNKFELL